MKKYLLLLGSLMAASSYAETTQVVQDDILKESAEVLKCAPTTSIPIPIPTPAPAAVAIAQDAPIKPKLGTVTEASEETFEDIEAPMKDLSPTEKLKAYRQKLEEKNLVLLEKKMEMIRLQQEMALLRNLEKSMNQTISALEKL